MNLGRSGQWRPTVAPYLEVLAKEVKSRGRSEASMAVDVAGSRMLITPFEQDLLLGIEGKGGESFARKHVLIRDSLGLRIKLQTEFEELTAAQEGERDAVLSEINSDVGLGCQLMHEITLEMNAMTADGEIEEAREFSLYRKQLSRLVNDAERLVSGRPESGSRRAIARNAYAPKTGPVVSARSLGAERSPVAAPRAAAGKGRWLLLSLLLIAAAGAVAVWLLFLR